MQNLEVASFWTGEPLSYFEITCIQSFLDHGYRFHLFTLDPVQNVPSGVELHDAREIYEGPIGDRADARFNAGVYSDVFRIYLMKKTPYMWVDTDIYCARPLDFEATHYFGVFRRKQAVNNCVLRLPANSPALRMMQNYVESDVPFPLHMKPRHLKPAFEAYSRGEAINLYTLPWTTTGPHLLTWALRSTGELARGQFWHTYYQYFSVRHKPYLATDLPTEQLEGPSVRFVHLIGATKIQLRDDCGGVPPEGSYMDTICKRHGIDPMHYPIPDGTTKIDPTPDA